MLTDRNLVLNHERYTESSKFKNNEAISGQFSKVYVGFFTTGHGPYVRYCLLASATVFQITSDIPPWRENAPIDLMNGSLIWMCSAISLVMAAIARRPHPAHGLRARWRWVCRP
jgi:hypothetical protein